MLVESSRVVVWTLTEGTPVQNGQYPVLEYQAFWTNAHETFMAEFLRLVGQHPNAEKQLRQLFKVLSDKDV
jgi:hypothetical protein